MPFMSGDVDGAGAIPGIGVGVEAGAAFFDGSPLDFMPPVSGMAVGLGTAPLGVDVGIGIFIGGGVSV